MRFVSFSTSEIPRAHLGIMHNNEIVDVDLAGQALRLSVPDQMLDLIANYDRYSAALQAIMDKAANRNFTEVRTFADIGAAHTLDEVQLAAPIPQPRKNVVCLAVNYREHAEEAARARGRSDSA